MKGYKITILLKAVTTLHLPTIMLTVSVVGALSTIYTLPVESVTLAEQVYTPVSAVCTLAMSSSRVVSLVALAMLSVFHALSGASQLDMIVAAVSTELPP